MEKVPRTDMGDCEWCRKKIRGNVYKLDEQHTEQFCSRSCAVSFDGYGDQHPFFDPPINYEEYE